VAPSWAEERPVCVLADQLDDAQIRPLLMLAAFRLLSAGSLLARRSLAARLLLGRRSKSASRATLITVGANLASSSPKAQPDGAPRQARRPASSLATPRRPHTAARAPKATRTLGEGPRRRADFGADPTRTFHFCPLGSPHSCRARQEAAGTCLCC